MQAVTVCFISLAAVLLLCAHPPVSPVASFLCVLIFVCVYVYVCLCVSLCMHQLAAVYVSAGMRACVCACVCACVQVCGRVAAVLVLYAHPPVSPVALA